MLADARPVVYPDRHCATAYGRPKVAYPSRRIAQRYRRLLRRLDQHIYRCPVCTGYHLGHSGE